MENEIIEIAVDGIPFYYGYAKRCIFYTDKKRCGILIDESVKNQDPKGNVPRIDSPDFRKMAYRLAEKILGGGYVYGDPDEKTLDCIVTGDLSDRAYVLLFDCDVKITEKDFFPIENVKDAVIDYLWQIIDDIDTASDIAKSDNGLYRKIVEGLQKKRWRTGITTDGYTLDMTNIKVPENLETNRELKT